MKHRTTAIELIIERRELYAITQKWAMESEFSFHAKDGNRMIYSKNIRGAKGWISIENNPNGAKVEAWQSSKNVGPEFEGNLLVGWKMPVPSLALGPNGVYKKQVNTLIKQLKGKSSRSVVVKERVPNFALNKSTFAKGLTWLGVLRLASGGIGLFSAAMVLNNPLVSNTDFLVTYPAFELIMGSLILLSARTLSRGKSIAIWLYGTSLLFDLIGNSLIGARLNYFYVVFAVIVIWQLIGLKKAGELSY